MKKLSIAEIKASYEQKKDWERQFPVSCWLFRPLSFPLTALLSGFTNSPGAIAWAGLGVGALACVLLFRLDRFGLWPGIAGLALFALLDAADGNMARATGSVTRYGKLLDGMLGKLIEGLYLPALSTGLYLADRSGPGGLLTPAPAGLLLSGFIALAAMLYSTCIESAYEALRNEAKSGEQPALNARIGSSRFRGNVLYMLFINLHAFNLQVVLLAFAAAFGRPEIFLFAAAAYYLVRFAALFAYFMRRAAAELS